MTHGLTTRVLDGRALAQQLRDDLALEVQRLAGQGCTPGLATILVGADPASEVYVAAKQRACAEAGIRGFDHRLPADASREQVIELIERLNADPEVSGILCQLPVPGHLDGNELTERISPDKDVDGLTIASAGRLALGHDGLRPCTPLGVMLLLEAAGAELRGARAVVVGRSNLFGKPMTQMLLAADATPTTCHHHTRDLGAVTREADVLIVAVGRPGLIGAAEVKPGAVVIDVGITRVDGRVVGDVAYDAVAEVASAITPVPGGVGPMTIACLLRNTVQAARTAAGLPLPVVV